MLKNGEINTLYPAGPLSPIHFLVILLEILQTLNNMLVSYELSPALLKDKSLGLLVSKS